MQISQLLRHKGREVATIAGSESVRTALGLLAEKGIGALVVSTDGRHVEGIVSERDVARGLHEHGAGLLAEPVSSLMTAQVHTCPPSASVHDLAQTMTDHRVRHVPVVDDDGVLVGIVSIGDVVKARLDELEDEQQAHGRLHPERLRRRRGRPLTGRARPAASGRAARRTVRRVDERRRGVLSGLGAYALWGLFPLYFPLLEPATGLEIVAHRVLWSLLFVGLLLFVLRRWSHVRAAVADRRTLLVLAGAAVLIAANWLIFVYGVNSGHVVETSLGYFINPLVSVLLGVVVLRGAAAAAAVDGGGHRRGRGRRADRRLRPAAVDRAEPGAHLRPVRPDEEAREGGGGAGALRGDGARRPPGRRGPRACCTGPGSGTFGAGRPGASRCSWPAPERPRRSRCCCSPRPPAASRCRPWACCNT